MYPHRTMDLVRGVSGDERSRFELRRTREFVQRPQKLPLMMLTISLSNMRKSKNKRPRVRTGFIAKQTDPHRPQKIHRGSPPALQFRTRRFTAVGWCLGVGEREHCWAVTRYTC